MSPSIPTVVSRTWFRLTAVLVIASLLWTAKTALASVLSAMHLPERPGYGPGSLAPFISWDSRRPSVAASTWRAFDQHFPPSQLGTRTASDIATMYLVLDGICGLVVALALVMGIRWIRRRLPHGREPQHAAGDEPVAPVPETAWGGAVWRRLTPIAIVTAIVAAAATVVADASATALVWELRDRAHLTPTTHAGWLYWVLFFAKWIAVVSFAGATLYVIGGLVTISRAKDEIVSDDRDDRLRSAAHAVRGFLLIDLVILYGLLRNDQAADMLRRMADDGVQMAAASVLAPTLGLFMAWRALALYETRGQPWNVSLRNRQAGVVVVSGVLLAAFGVTTVLTDHGGQGLLIPAAVLIVVGVVELIVRRLEERIGAPVVPAAPDAVSRTGVTGALPAALALLPPLALALALVSAAVPDLAYKGHNRYIWLIGMAVVMAVVSLGAAAVAVELGGRDASRSTTARLVGWGAFAVVLLAIVSVYAKPWTASSDLGTPGLAFVWAAGLAGLVWALTWISERVVPPRLFALLGFKRIPVIALSVIWLLGASMLDKGTYHNVRQVSADSLPQPTLEAAFQEWLSANGLGQTPSAGTSSTAKRARPLILVAADGGGVRAAYWTALVLDCVLDPSDQESCGQHGAQGQAVFAASGASGGSLGLTEFAAHQFDGAVLQPDSSWVDNELYGDFVSPTVAHALFFDLPNSLADFHGLFDDRAAILEQAWERQNGRLGTMTLGDLWTDRASTDTSTAIEAQRAPLLFLNGTTVQDGCRFNTSVLALGAPIDHTGATTADSCSTIDSSVSAQTPPYLLPATHDVSTYLCPKQDVRLSTAALLSARFPYVTPSGRLNCGDGQALNVVDGGYFDNTGAGSLIALWHGLRPLVDAYNTSAHPDCLVPLFLQVDNHYAGSSAPSGAHVNEFTVPPSTVNATRDGHESENRQGAAVTFQRNVAGAGAPLPGWIVIRPATHPGSQPPLGWSLSSNSRDDLKHELSLAAGQLANVQRWFSTDLGCGPLP